MLVKIKLLVCGDEYNDPKSLGPLVAQRSKHLWSLGKSWRVEVL